MITKYGARPEQTAKTATGTPGVLDTNTRKSEKSLQVVQPPIAQPAPAAILASESSTP